MKKSLALILAMVMMLTLLSGCGGGGTTTPPAGGGSTTTPPAGGGSTTTPPAGGGSTTAPPAGGGSTTAPTGGNGDVSGLGGRKTKITAGLANNVPTLKPDYRITEYSDVITSTIFEHLGQYAARASEDFVGVIMKDWKTETGGSYDIEIYDYIYDSAGNHLTANDVKYSIEMTQKAGVAQANLAESVTVNGDYKLTINFGSPMVGVFEEFCQNVWIFTQAAMEASSDEMATTPVGTGRYVLLEYISGSHAEMQKRDDYWQKPELIARCSAANIDVIRTQFITENTQMAIACETGSIQLGFWLGVAIAKDLQNVPGRKYEEVPDLGSRMTHFNCSENSIFGGPNGKLLRQAVLYAIDEKALITLALDGIGQPAKGFGMPGSIGYNKAWESQPYYYYDLAKAKELLAEAGYPNGFSITILSSDNNRETTYTQVLQTMLAAIGVKAELSWQPSAVLGQFRSDLTAWDITIDGYSVGNQYQAGLFNYIANNTTRGNGYSLGGIKDDNLQAMLMKAISLDWTQADLDLLHDTIVENAYCYKHYEQMNLTSCVDLITDTYRNWRQDIQMQSFTYSDDWSFFAN